MICRSGNTVDSHGIREAPGSNPGSDQSDWVFRRFPQSSRQILGWIFITMIHLTINYQIHIYIYIYIKGETD